MQPGPVRLSVGLNQDSGATQVTAPAVVHQVADSPVDQVGQLRTRGGAEGSGCWLILVLVLTTAVLSTALSALSLRACNLLALRRRLRDWLAVTVSLPLTAPSNWVLSGVVSADSRYSTLVLLSPASADPSSYVLSSVVSCGSKTGGKSSPFILGD